MYPVETFRFKLAPRDLPPSLLKDEGVAVKENGPKETVEQFGEVYMFSPNFFAVHREEPTTVRFWNLQPDDPPALKKRIDILGPDGYKLEMTSDR